MNSPSIIYAENNSRSYILPNINAKVLEKVAPGASFCMISLGITCRNLIYWVSNKVSHGANSADPFYWVFKKVSPQLVSWLAGCVASLLAYFFGG